MDDHAIPKDIVVVEQPGEAAGMALDTASGAVSLRGGDCSGLDECLPCESGDYWYDHCCYWCLGSGSQNP